MPLYEFECECGKIFERISSYEDEISICEDCGKEAKKRISTFSHKVAGGSPNESIDMTIGRAADSRWTKYHDRQSRRRKGVDLRKVETPKVDGSYRPVMALGDKKERQSRKEYSTAIQGVRKELKNKGKSQFDGPGVF